MSNSCLNSPSLSSKEKYSINIISSEPQVVDIKKNFYIEDKRINFNRRKSFSLNTSKPLVKAFTEKELLFDKYLTNKVKQHENIDDILDDEQVQKFLK